MQTPRLLWTSLLALGPALERLVVRLEALLALVREEDPPDGP